MGFETCIETFMHHRGHGNEQFHHPQQALKLPLCKILLLLPWIIAADFFYPYSLALQHEV